MSPRLVDIQRKVWWVLYLISSHNIFALPDPVFPHQQPVYIPTPSGRSNNNDASHFDADDATTNPTPTSFEPTAIEAGGVGGEEPVVEGSSIITAVDNLIMEGSSPFHRNTRNNGPPRKPPRRRPPPRRHPPSMKAPMPPPPQKPLLIKPSSLHKPKKPSIYKYHHDDDHDLVPKKKHPKHKRPPPPPRSSPPPPRSPIDDVHDHFGGDSNSIEVHPPTSTGNRRPSLRDLMRDEIPNHSVEARSFERSKQRERDRDRDRDQNRPFVRDEYYPPSGSSSGGGDSTSIEDKHPNPPPPSKSTRNPPPPPSKSTRNPNPPPPPTIPTRPNPLPNNPQPAPSSFHEGPAPPSLHGGPAPFPKPPRPVQLSYYYDSDDKTDLKTLISSHHLKRRGKECDGLENFIYDLEVIAFLMGIVSVLIGLYTDVIPFFNDGVKINYSNNYGDGADFPHDYWNTHDAKIDAIVSKRTISIGTSQDNAKEVLGVGGEFLSIASLGISFVALFPSLVEKFFYSLDWWFGKRGLWKQYLYTYKCEIHPYPEVGWGR